MSGSGRRRPATAALLGIVAAAAAASARAAPTTTLSPPGGGRPFLTLHASGTQDYLCLPAPDRPGATGWVFVRPEAVLTLPGRHGSLPDRAEHALLEVPGRTARAAPGCVEAADGAHEYCPSWRSPSDGSTVWGSRVGSEKAGSAADCPNRGAVACLLLRAVATAGPAGSFAAVRWVERIRTVGGAAPTTSCDTGRIEQVPYSADYAFFRDRR